MVFMGMRAPTLSTMINQLKGYASKLVGFPMWQKGYYEEIFRNDKAYQKVWQYIDNNPVKWLDDEYYINNIKGNGNERYL